MRRVKQNKKKSSSTNSTENKKNAAFKKAYLNKAHFNKVDFLLALIFGVFLVLLAIASISYVRSPTLLDHFEVHVACISHRVWLGHPIYHDWDAPDRYSTIMGPNTYLWNALWQGPHPESFFDAKLPGIVSCWLAVILLGVIVLRKYGLNKAFIACGALPLIGLMFYNFMYWNRSDPLLLLLLVIGVIGALLPNVTFGAILFGAAAGLAFGAKFHSVIFFLPLLAYFHRKVLSWKILAAGTCTAALAVVLPFLFPHVSLRNYLKFLGTVQEGPKLSDDLGWVVLIVAVLSLPAIALFFKDRERRWIRLLCWCAPALLILALTAVYGLERHHIMPLAVPFALILVELLRHKKTLVTWGILALLIVVVGGIALQKWNHNQKVIRFEWRFSEIDDEVNSILERTEGLKRAMGYSGLKGHGLSQWRVLLVFRGENTLYLDGPALMDHRKGGIPLPSSTVDAIERRDVDLWLIPKGGDPWSLRHYYNEDWEVFPEEFKRAFRENYKQIDTTKYYTLWLAKDKQLPGKNEFIEEQ